MSHINFHQQLNLLKEICVANDQEHWYEINAPLLRRLASKAPNRATELVRRFIDEFDQKEEILPENHLDYPSMKNRIESWMDHSISERNTVVSVLIGTHNLRRFQLSRSIFTFSSLLKISLLAGNANEIRTALEQGLERQEVLETHPNSDLPMVVVDEGTKNLVFTAIYGKNKGNAKKIDYLAYEDYFAHRIPEYFTQIIHDWNVKIVLIATTNGGCGVMGNFTILEECRKFLSDLTLVLLIEKPSSELVMGASLNTTIKLAALLSSPRYHNLRIFRYNQDIFDKHSMGEDMLARSIEALITGIKFSHSEYTAGADFSDFVVVEEAI